MIIKTRNLLDIEAPITYLQSAITSGTTSLIVKNTAGFTSQWAVQVGKTGEEQAEVVIGTVSNGTTITTPTLSFSHPSDTPIYAIKYNQVIFERSTSGTSGTATPITSGTINYQSDHQFTQFDDTTGASTYAYKARFYNSITAGSTSQSDWLTPSGFTFYSLAALRQRIKDKLWSSDYIKDDITIDNWINEWKDEMSNAVISVNQEYSMGTVDIAFGTAGLGTVSTADFSQVRRFETTYNGTDYFLSTKMGAWDYTPTQVFSSAHPYHNWEGDTVFRVHPPSTGGTARLTFYRFGSTLVNDTDELSLPMRPYTKSFVDYGVAQAYLKDDKGAQ